MKKVIVFCLVIILLLSLSACGKDQKHTVEILIPEGCTDFVCSDQWFCAKGDGIEITVGKELPEAEVMLMPGNDFLTGFIPAALPAGATVKLDMVEGEAFAIGVSLKESQDADTTVTLVVEGVDLFVE